MFLVVEKKISSKYLKLVQSPRGALLPYVMLWAHCCQFRSQSVARKKVVTGSALEYFLLGYSRGFQIGCVKLSRPFTEFYASSSSWSSTCLYFWSSALSVSMRRLQCLQQI